MSDPVQLYTIAEGPTDAIVIKAVLEHLGRRYTWTALQPEGDGIDGPVQSEHGLGWRDGVRAYCRSERETITVSLQLGVVVVQVDADVASKNKSDFERDLTRPCPPARGTCDEVRKEILTWLGVPTPPEGLVLCVPAQSSEAWIIAALKPDLLQKHLKTKISRGMTNKEKERHNALGPGAVFECHPKLESLLAQVGLEKSPGAYDEVQARLIKGWEHARTLPEALRFETELEAALP